MAFVITHPVHGIYLGTAMGLGFWSRLDPVGQPCAVTFASRKEALEHIAMWRDADGHPCDATMYGLHPVTPDQADGYASIQACVQAGLEGWLDEAVQTANERMC